VGYVTAEDGGIFILRRTASKKNVKKLVGYVMIPGSLRRANHYRHLKRQWKKQTNSRASRLNFNRGVFMFEIIVLIVFSFVLILMFIGFKYDERLHEIEKLKWDIDRMKLNDLWSTDLNRQYREEVANLKIVLKDWGLADVPAPEGFKC